MTKLDVFEMTDDLAMACTKRELFAAMVLAGMQIEEYSFDGAAQDAVKHADALIAELNKAPDPKAEGRPCHRDGQGE